MSILNLRLMIILVALATLFSLPGEPIPSTQKSLLDPVGLSTGVAEVLGESPLQNSDHQKIESWKTMLPASEWLGPLAPIAISPFFGITMLAGISQFGDGYFSLSSFISDSPVLKSPAVFWVFLFLTLLTSVPKFSKVSKPLAQAIDQLEAYAGIVTIIVIKIAASMASGADPAPVALVQMGFLTVTSDVLFAVAAVINILIINGVKFFFEVVVWLTPLPFVDAILEVANKLLCVLLMALYAWSPALATLINLVMFAVCLVAFRWTHRRVQYIRAMLSDPALATLIPSWGKPERRELEVFSQKSVGPFAAKAKLLLTPSESGWRLTQVRWFLPGRVYELPREGVRLKMKQGLMVNTIEVSSISTSPDGGASTTGGASVTGLTFSRRYQDYLPQLAELLDIRLAAQEPNVDLRQDFKTL